MALLPCTVLTRHLRRAAAQMGIRGKTTHFGFTDVTEEEKQEKVHGVFESVASSYDTMNDLMSVGVHRLWKDRLMAAAGPLPRAKLLDMAGGTGDISFRWIHRLLYEHQQAAGGATSATPDPHPATHVTVCDLSEGMLREGQRRGQSLGYEGMSWVCGNALDAPFPNNSFDCYTIAYGIRNVTDVQKALNEAYRVLRPGGRFLCLEFSRVPNTALRWLYDQYSFAVIPPLGHVVTGDWASYQYLVESIRKFPDQESFSGMIERAGFRRVRYENITFGVTALHTAFKL